LTEKGQKASEDETRLRKSSVLLGVNGLMEEELKKETLVIDDGSIIVNVYN